MSAPHQPLCMPPPPASCSPQARACTGERWGMKMLTVSALQVGRHRHLEVTQLPNRLPPQPTTGLVLL